MKTISRLYQPGCLVSVYCRREKDKSLMMYSSSRLKIRSFDLSARLPGAQGALNRRNVLKNAFVIAGLFASLPAHPCFAAESYLEPGSFRLSHVLSLENITHRLKDGWSVRNDGQNKAYSQSGDSEQPWKSEWGQRLLTEAAARVTPGIFGRVLFDLQGEYADRFWRPNNIYRYSKRREESVILRQAEARLENESSYVHAFSGVPRINWEAQGDFMRVYPAAIPDDDYLGGSGYFSVHPSNWRQDLFLNISRRNVPRGFEAGAQFLGLDGAVAYGDELAWGYSKSAYGRLGATLRSSRITFVTKDSDVPYRFNKDEDERDRAYALSWLIPFEEGHRIDMGILYEPFRVDDPYRVADRVGSGTGLQGSDYTFSNKTSKKEDAFAGRLRLERHATLLNRAWVFWTDLFRGDVLAGNREQADFHIGTDITRLLRGNVIYTYRRPVEGPLPFLYEGTPNNIGAVVSSPRGPESPFTVNQSNREAVFILATLIYDRSPATPLFMYDPTDDATSLALWNVTAQKTTPFACAVQYRMSDYRTATDRQYYYDKDGNIVWEPAAHTGAWPTDHPLSEARVMVYRSYPSRRMALGLAGGQKVADLGLAYSNDTAAATKPITEYISVEGRLDLYPFSYWAHYGSGMWGPEPFQFAFGESFDRLWGLGITYNITTNTNVDVGYLAARQDDSLFVASDLGAYDEIRVIFSHRFGFLLQFSEASRPGYKAR